MEQSETKNRATLIVHSGAYDRVSYALSLALVALAMGMEVYMLFTYGGLKRLVNGHTEDMDQETTPELREIIQRGLAKGTFQSITDSLTEAKKMGLKVYACAGAMANLNIVRDELIPEVDKVIGLASFLQLCQGAAMTWYV
ncbi:MAG: DsrE/DsrF/DrsH-like family protein [Thermodesulfobacteriota bacterium]